MNKLCLYRKFPVVIFLFVTLFGVKAQNNDIPPLERIVTIDAENKTVESVLEDISSQAGFIFSYNPDIINSGRLVTYKAENKSVRFVLSDLLDKSIIFRVMGKYVILESENGFKEKMKLEGYLYDSRTGERICNASIYDKTLMTSTVTDRYGYFSLELSPLSSNTSFQICKTGYADTSITKAAVNKNNRLIELMLNKVESTTDSARAKFSLKIPPWLVPQNIWTNSVNIRESWSKAFQISLLPGIGTNRFLGGNVENRFSLNIIGGYTKGVSIMEAGGIFNIVQNDAGYCQIGGVCNFVGGTSRGAQIAGIYNSASTSKGAQVGGIFNVSHGSSDVQISGVLNRASDSKIQLAGVANSSALSSDVQVSGIINSAGSSLVQIAGLVNISGRSKILQAGLVNISDTSRGVSVGLVNISKNSDGVNIGLINFVKNGYHKFELSSDEILFANLAFRSGTKAFHSIITTGMRPFGNEKGVWGLGYGIGTSIGKQDRLTWDFEATSTELFYGKGLNTVSQNHRLYAGFDRKATEHFSVAAGISFNFLVVNRAKAQYDYIYTNLPPYSIHILENSGGYNYDSWIGAKVALRFF
jgi:hypothetical protein